MSTARGCSQGRCASNGSDTARLRVMTWADSDAPRYTAIGGNESGADAAVQLVRLGRRARLLARRSTWDPQSAYDPSLSLSPFTRGRLYEAMDTGRLEIVLGADVAEVGIDATGGYRIHAADGRHWDKARPPIIGTGFLKSGGAWQIADLWEWNDEGRISLSDIDESTRTPGLFLIGPQVRHDRRIYCFIYKFRQRFAAIARAIADRLELDTGPPRQPGGAWGPYGNSKCRGGCEC